MEVGVSFDRDTGWLLINGGLQLGDALVRDMRVTGGFNLSLLLIPEAVKEDARLIWVVRFELKSVILGVLESIDLETSHAAM